jgi:hypothetical protein
MPTGYVTSIAASSAACGARTIAPNLGRYTPSGIQHTAVTPADLASGGPARPHPGVVS